MLIAHTHLGLVVTVTMLVRPHSRSFAKFNFNVPNKSKINNPKICASDCCVNLMLWLLYGSGNDKIKVAHTTKPKHLLFLLLMRLRYTTPLDKNVKLCDNAVSACLHVKL